MATELKRGFLEEAIAAYAKEFSLSEDDAFMYWFYSVLFDVEYDDIPLDEIIDGEGERQIDIFKIDVDDAQQKVCIHLIQVKNTKGFSANTVSLMKVGLDFAFKAKRSEFEKLKNAAFVEKISNVREILLQYGNNSLEVRCYFVTLGDESEISEEAKQNRQNVIAEYGDSKVFGDFSFSFLGVNELDRLINLRRNKKRVINYDLPIIYDANRASIIEFDAGGVASVLCTVSGVELAKLAQSEPRDAVFDANVRGNLGLGGQVNRSIYESACEEEHSNKFWFMNNGITMVCDDFSLVRDPDKPTVKIRNLQIINGCQTTSSIRSAYEDDMLSDKVRLQLKIYASKDAAFVDSVVVATNNQNSINTRDLHANDEVQVLIQRRIQEDFGLFYERKRGEAKGQKVSKSEVIGMEKAGQAFLAIFRRQPTVSRAQKYKIYSNEFYDDVFSKAKPWQLAIAHELYKFADLRGRRAYREREDSDPSRSILNYGVFHIARILWWVLEQDNAVKTSDPATLIKQIRDEADFLEKAYERSNEILSEIVKGNNESLVNLNNYFKKALSQQHINQHLKELEGAG